MAKPTQTILSTTVIGYATQRFKHSQMQQNRCSAELRPSLASFGLVCFTSSPSLHSEHQWKDLTNQCFAAILSNLFA